MYESSSGPVRVERREDSLVIQIQRPERRNAVNFAVIDALEALLASPDFDTPVRPIVWRGSNGWFASGGDLREFASLSGSEAGRMAQRMRNVLSRIECLPVPTVAALDGPAIGGGAEIALAFDMRVVLTDVYLQFPQAHLGIPTGWGGGARLLQLVGRSRALELLLTGRRVEASRAREIGLVNEVWSPASFERNLQSLVQDVKRAGTVTPAIKSLLNSQEPGANVDDVESDWFERLWDQPARALAMEEFNRD